MKGHVYLIAPKKLRKGWVKGKGTMPFKIGVSKSIEGVKDRLKALNAGNWVELNIVNISPEFFQPYHAELYLHGCYSKKKIRGEWFKLSYAEYRYVYNLLEQEPKSREMQECGKIMRDWGGWQWWF